MGVSAGSRTLLLQASANSSFRSALFVVNPNESPATATLVARDGNPTNNGTVTASRTVLIPANGLLVTENLLQELGAGNSFGPVEIHADLPIIAVSRVYKPSGNTSGFLKAQVIP